MGKICLSVGVAVVASVLVRGEGEVTSNGKSVTRASENIVFRDCRFEGADRMIHYNLSGNERWQKGPGLA